MKIRTPHFLLIAILLFWIILPIISIILNHILGLPIYIFSMFRGIGIFLIAIGLTLAVTASRTFSRLGHGTPALIQPPQKLVIKGIYTKTRNPIYIAHILIYLGSFILFGHLLLLILTATAFIAFHLYLIHVEEPALHRRYPNTYIKYTQSTPRWL